MSLINCNNKILKISEQSLVRHNLPQEQVFTIDVKVNDKLERICLKGLVALLCQLGINQNEFNYDYLEDLPKVLNIQKKYNRLFIEIIEELLLQDYLLIENSRIIIAHDMNTGEITMDKVVVELEAFGNEFIDYKVHSSLLIRCFNDFKSILIGQTRATDVIFPLGTLAHVEGIYKGNKQADYFNALLADQVAASVANALYNLPDNETIKILEIGAGTGGTTKSVFEKLVPFINKIEYTFTDLSKSFLINAEKSFGAYIPHFETQILDIENDPIAQGFTKGKYDIIIAANVLHATKDITETLSNLKKILKSKGLIFLNEIARKELFTTLTFGLLDGWWLYQDAELRLKNNPGLIAENWAMVLDEVGFEKLYFYPLNNTCSQQIIAAQSNGLIEETNIEELQFKQIETNVDIQKYSSNVLQELKELFGTILQTNSNRLDIHAPFEELGIDSILIGTLAKELGNKIGDISTTIFFEYGTIEELSHYLMEHYGHLYKNDTIPVLNEISIDLKSVVETYLKGVFGDLLQFDEHKIDIHAPFEELGIDSIMIGSIAKKMQEKVGEIPTTVFFEYTTVAELGQYLVNNHSGCFEEKTIVSASPTGQVRAKLEEQKNIENDETIAIIGLSGKYPGADNVDELWENLKIGKDSITEIPIKRWDNTIYFDELKGKIGKNYCKYGGFINGVDEFDPLFFKISPREAERMDPQERLFLQTAWEAVEDAGYNFKDLSRRSQRFENIHSGVYVGVMYEEYQLHGATIDIDQGKVALGGNPAGIANRVSYCLDFDGPSMAVDTMCSSSLTSIHLACNDLKNGDVDVAIAGGVNVSVHPNKYLVLSKGTFLSPNGKCESFGNEGQGFVPGEGVGAVVLKRLSDAINDGDRIYATIKGTAINHGGKGNGYTIPNPAAQANLISKALNKAGLSGNEIDYIEAHGTGTVLGDPIEIEGLTRAFATDKKQFCKIGSIKSNIGHCESAAGISGLTKVLLQLKHKQFVPSLHATTLNTKIDFENSPFSVQQKLETWGVKNGKLRSAGISGFGAGGSNAHIIIQEYPQTIDSISLNRTALIVLSAKNKERLKAHATQLKRFLDKNKDLSIHNIEYTLQIGRVEMEERLAIVVTNIEDLKEELSLFLSDVSGIYKTDTINEQQTPLDTFEIQVNITNKNRVALAEQWVKGAKIDWILLYKDEKRNKLSLPTYPFEKQSYWFDSFFKKGNKPVKKETIKSEYVKTLYTENATQKGAENIRVEYVDNRIAIVHMEAKETKNMFTYDFVNGLYTTFNNLKVNEAIKVVVLTGYENVFAMGGSKEGLLDLSNEKGKYTDIPFIYKGLLEFDLPVITAMQGHAFGGGLVFGLYGDIVLMSGKSTYCANFMNYGFTPGMGATHIIGEKLGKNVANEMLFTGRMYSGNDIANNGANVRVSDNVLKDALKIAREIASKPKEALKLLKQKLAQDILVTQEYHIQKEIVMQNKTFGTPEVKAKIEKQFIVQEPINDFPVLNQSNDDQTLKLNTSGKIFLESPQAVTLKETTQGFLPEQKVKLSNLLHNIATNEEAKSRISNTDLTDSIKTIISNTLHIDQAEIASDVLFVELGLDSINGVEILREINDLLNINLEGPVLYEYGTVNALVKYLSKEYEIDTIIKNSSNELVIDALPNIITENPNNFNSNETRLHLKKIIKDVLHLDKNEIEDDAIFTELGMDSINGVEIIREINTTYEINLEGVVLYDYPTVNQLVNHICKEVITLDYSLATSIELSKTEDTVVSKANSLNGIDQIEDAKSALQTIIGNILHLDINQIKNDLNFTELGMDSINGVEIIREVNTIFDTVLEASDLYKYATINDLAKMLTQDNIKILAKKPTQIKTLSTEPFDLSYMQQAYWVGENKDLELGGKQAHLTVRFAYNNFEIDRLDNAVNKLIQRHDILKVQFLENGKQQVLNRSTPFVTHLKSLENVPTNEVENTIIEFVDAKRKKGPNKFEWPQFDFTVFKTNVKDELIINLSLLVCDGGSVSIFFRELFEIYFNPEKELPALKLTFQDYINHLSLQKKSEKYRVAKDYWKKRLDTLPLGPELPYQLGKESGIMVHKERKIDSHTFELLKERAKKNNVSLSVLLCTIYTKVLAYYSRNQHFSLTMMTLGREYPSTEINKVLGNFSQISVLELDYRNKQNFLEELNAVSNQIWEDQKHASYTGIEVIRDLNLTRGILGKIAIPMTFASAFGLGYDKNYAFERVSASLQVPQVGMDHQVCEESDGSLLISFDIDEGFFQDNVTNDIIASYEKLIRQITIINWNDVVEGVLLDKHLKLIEETNNTKTPLTEQYLFDPFDKNAFTFPQKTAVIDGDIRKTYGELQELSNRIGSYFRLNGIVPNQLVGLMMHKGWEEVPSTLGIMKSGGAYLPIDPNMPESRLAFILKKAEVKDVIVTKDVFDKGINVPEGVNVLVFEEAFINQPIIELSPLQKITDLAYAIFTSGSTGYPKGVMIDHRGALNTCLDINKRFDRSENDTVLALSALYFDLSVYDIFGLLACGGTIVFPNYQKLKDPRHWAELVEKHKVTIWNSVPELMNMFIEYNALLGKKRYDHFNLVLMSGDWIPVTLPTKIKQALPAAKLISLGGATEASIWSISHEIKAVDPEMKSIPYGKALANQSMHILNDHLEPCPLLTTGNIYIGGVGVAKGYLKDEEKTNQHFVYHPKTKEIIYKTGDLGRVMRNGDIEFLGREDFQVKVQGYRIELGDIESTVLRSKMIKATAVDVKKDVIGNNFLVAYVVPQDDTLFSEKELLHFLQGQLQGYMVPKFIVKLNELPKSSNGKIDRKSLPEPKSKKNIVDNAPIIPTETRNKLKTIWKELLVLDFIEEEDDFFELGGNSLLAIRLAAKIESDLDISIDLSEILQNSNLKEQLNLLTKKVELEEDLGKSIVCIKNANAEGQPLFLVHPIGGSVFCYNQLARYINPNTPVYGFHATGNQIKDVVSMASKYIKEMKEVQKEGPYRIGGWSFGGIIAFEMTQQLEKVGEEVKDLFLIDSYFHSKGYDFENSAETEIFEKFLKDITYQRGGEPILPTTMEDMLAEAIQKGLFPTEITLDSIYKLLQVFKNNCIAYSGYQVVNKVNADTHLLMAKDTSYIGSERQMKTWENWLNGAISYHIINGNHFTIFEGESLQNIINILNVESKLIHS